VVENDRGKVRVLRGVASAESSAGPTRWLLYSSSPLERRKPVRLVHGCDSVASDMLAKGGKEMIDS
jgi:hypothetical protein